MANTIASERKLLGLSQEQLGERLRKDRTTISRYEADPDRIDGGTLKELSDLFNCSVDYLLGRTDERTPYRKAS